MKWETSSQCFGNNKTQGFRSLAFSVIFFQTFSSLAFCFFSSKHFFLFFFLVFFFQRLLPALTSSELFSQKTVSDIKAKFKVEEDASKHEDAHVVGSILNMLTHSSTPQPSVGVSITVTKRQTLRRRIPNRCRAHDREDDCLYAVPDCWVLCPKTHSL